MAYTFFTIEAPEGEDPRSWAKKVWDTYGFDYDTERFGSTSVCAWPLVDEDMLREALEEDDLEFTTFEVDDLDAFFGL